MKFKSDLITPRFKPEDSFESSVNVLQNGIMAEKHNWSNTVSKNVIVTVSKDCKSLLWKKPVKDRTFWDKLKGGGKLPISHILGIAFGGTTGTFDSIRKNIVNIHAIKRPGKQTIFSHYDERRDVRTMRDGNFFEMLQETMYT